MAIPVVEKIFKTDMDTKLKMLPLEDTLDGMIRFVAFNGKKSGRSSLLAYGGFGDVSILCTETWEKEIVFKRPCQKRVVFGEFSSDDQWFVWSRNTAIYRAKVPKRFCPSHSSTADAKSKDWTKEEIDAGFPVDWGAISPDSKVVFYGGYRGGENFLRAVHLDSDSEGCWRAKSEEPIYEVGIPTRCGAFSPNGDFLIFSTPSPTNPRADHLVRLNWPEETGSSQLSQRPPCVADGQVWTVAFFPKGDFFAFCNADKLMLARSATLDVVHEILVGSEIRFIKFSPSRDLLAYGGQDKITLISAFTYDVVKEIPLNDEPFAVDFNHNVHSRNGRMLAFGGKGRMVKIVRPDSWEVLHHHMIDDAASQVNDIAFTQLSFVMRWLSSAHRNEPNGNKGTSLQMKCICAVALESRNSVRVYDLGQDGLDWKEIPQDWETQCARAIEFSPDGRFLAIGGTDNKPLLVSTSDWSVCKSEKVDDDIMCIAFSPDSRYVVYGARKFLLVIDTANMVVVRELISVRCARFTPCLRTSSCDEAVHSFWLAVGNSPLDESNKRQMLLLDTNSWQERGSYETRDLVNAIDFSSDGALVAFGGKDRSVTVLRTNFKDDFSTDLDQLAKSGPESSRKSIRGQNTTATLADLDRDWLLELNSFVFEVGFEVMALQFSPNGEYLAFGGKNKKVQLAGEDVKGHWKVLKDFDHGFEVKGLSFNADGALLGFCGVDGTMTILDLSTSPPEHEDVPTTHELHNWIKSGKCDKVQNVVKKFPALLTFPGVSFESRNNPALQVCIEKQQSELAAFMLEARPMLAYVSFEELGGDKPGQLAMNKRDRIVVEALFKASLQTSVTHPDGVFDLKELFKIDFFRRLAGNLFENLQLVTVPCSVKTASFHRRRMWDRILDSIESLFESGPRRTKTELVRASRWDSPNGSGLWQSESDESGYSVVARRAAWPGLGSVDLLRLLTEAEDDRIFGSPTMQIVVTAMWEHAVKKQLLKKCFKYVAFATLYSLAAHGIHEVNAGGAKDDIFSHLCQLASLCLVVTFVSFEALQCQHQGPRDYLSDFWNWFDMISYLLVMFIIVIHLLVVYGAIEIPPENLELFSIWVGISILLVYSNTLQLLSGFQRTSVLVQILIVIFQDIIPFLAVMLIVVAGFSNFFYFSLKGTSDEKFEEDTHQRFGNFGASLFETMKVGLFGDLELMLETLHSNHHYVFIRFMLVFYLIVTLIVMLNALIAIMGDSYSRVADSLHPTMCRQRAKVVVELLEVDPNRAQIEEDTKWIHVFAHEHSPDLRGDWAGQLNAIRKEIKTSLSNFEKVQKEWLTTQIKDLEDTPQQLNAIRQIQHQTASETIELVSDAISRAEERLTRQIKAIQLQKGQVAEASRESRNQEHSQIALRHAADESEAIQPLPPLPPPTHNMQEVEQEYFPQSQNASYQPIAMLFQQMQRNSDQVAQMGEHMLQLQEQMQKLQASNDEIFGIISRLRDRKKSSSSGQTSATAQPAVDLN
eukprot:gnl/MRDRNA2_/MRDRNA2_98495_c0_seq1.p1 gnl/MRDRNA2_/MRDRNA2_98495_c0~~gnl/MRDRNA2_/MRDRNA2_98495_c0_seq1.p1  ORF type:complete len:1525 (+),score=232.33 gnl/MRDRNA2_/MRDRNA2_98495_c0_seq1:92-4576(+)